MLGAIVGDIVGSIYEFDNQKSKDFPLFQDWSQFTDDTVLTCATAQSILEGTNYADSYRAIGLNYANAGYGAQFIHWLMDDSMGPYGSFGNGAAMRVSPIAWAFDTEEEVLAAARASAEASHNHPEGIKGAQATALAVFLARKNFTKHIIRMEISERFEYNLSIPLDEIRRTYEYNESCQETVPQAIRCYLEANDFEDAIRNAVSLGGDSDTLAAIAGSIAEAAFGIPNDIVSEATGRLDRRLGRIVKRFSWLYVDRPFDSVQTNG